jgi:chaperonin GroES
MAGIANIARRLKPLGSRVLVQRMLTEAKSAGGIILSEPVKSNQGLVVSVGPGDTRADGSLKAIGLAVDQVVYLPEYGGVKIPNSDSSDQNEFILYREDEILAVLEE